MPKVIVKNDDNQMFSLEKDGVNGKIHLIACDPNGVRLPSGYIASIDTNGKLELWTGIDGVRGIQLTKRMRIKVNGDYKKDDE